VSWTIDGEPTDIRDLVDANVIPEGPGEWTGFEGDRIDADGTRTPVSVGFERGPGSAHAHFSTYAPGDALHVGGGASAHMIIRREAKYEKRDGAPYQYDGPAIGFETTANEAAELLECYGLHIARLVQVDHQWRAELRCDDEGGGACGVGPVPSDALQAAFASWLERIRP